MVLSSKGEIKHFSHRLLCVPIISVAADFGLIGRQRLWWTRHPWSSADCYPKTCTSLRWTKVSGIPRLQTSLQKDDAASLQPDGLHFHADVLSGSASLPCMTTPSPSPNGRPAPKSSKSKLSESARQRWLEDSRRFAPWHYEPTAMMTDAEGKFYVIPPDVKEALHHFPPGYTAHPAAQTNDRHRMLGNSWHLGVVKLLLLLLLSAHVAPASASVPRGPCTTALQKLIEWSLLRPACLGPARTGPEPPLVAPCANMYLH